MSFVLCTDIEMLSIKKRTKSRVKKNIFYFEIIIKPNVDIVGITVSVLKNNEFETIFTSNDITNIQDRNGKGFGSREIS